MPKRNRLVKFFQAFSISRPASLLRLPGLQAHYHDFLLYDSELVKLVALLVFKFYEQFWWPAAATGDQVSSDDGKSRALYYATMVQQAAANMELLQDNDLGMVDRLRQQESAQLDQFLADRHTANDGSEKLTFLRNLVEQVKSTTHKTSEHTSKTENIEQDVDLDYVPNESDDEDRQCK